MTSTERVDLEIDLRQKKLQAVDSYQKYILEMYNQNEYGDSGSFAVEMYRCNHERDQLTVEIAEMKLTLYDLLGGPCEEATPQEPQEEA